jgi:heat-inducible transcriptional repressor
MIPRLEPREKIILRSVVRTYVDTAAPVGSKRVAEESGLGCSAATIRSLMSRMEERGLIRQPHTSAGRVPTDRGYRVYVDAIMEPVALTRAEQEGIFFGVERAARGPERMPAALAGILSDVSGQMGFASAPRLEDAVFRSLHGVRAEGGRIAFHLTLDSGLVRSAVVSAEEALPDEALARGVAEVNRLFGGWTIARVRSALFGAEWATHLPGGPFSRIFREGAAELLGVAGEPDASVAGFETLLTQPEFRGPGDLESLTGLLRKRGSIPALLESDVPTESVALWIGEENEREELRRFSVAAARYRLGRFQGLVGVVGPTRMSYERALASIACLTHVVGCRAGDEAEA